MTLDLDALNQELESLSLSQRLTKAVALFGKEVVLASSLGAEDQVLTHAFVQVASDARIFVLDTGRLHQETYDVMAVSQAKYQFAYDVYFPQTQAVETLLRSKGPNSFYNSIEDRKECCYIRKVEPLNRALSTCKAWITGLRREQAVTRQSLPFIEIDEAHQCYKLNLLADWTLEHVWTYLKQNDVPYNRLHDQGYPSIGCAPCTRAIASGEDIRAGRWWWENPETKECGLHIKEGKPVRKKESL